MSSKKNVEEARKEFAGKEAILQDACKWLSPWDFYSLLFSDFTSDDKIMVVEAGRRYVAQRYDMAIEYGLGRDDVYFCPAVFWQDFKRDTKIDKLYAFVIDIDNVKPSFLSVILSGIKRGAIPSPTVITNSGSGIHFYYILAKPLVTYPSVRKMAFRLYDELNRSFEFKTDKHSLGHAFRMVGGTTKYGDISTAYQVGGLWNVEELADAIDLLWEFPTVGNGGAATEKMREFATYLAGRSGEPLPDFEKFGETFDYIKRHKVFVNKTYDLSQRDLDRADMFTDSRPNGQKGWYYYTKQKIIERAAPEHRYSSLMALCVIAYKCRIPQAEIEQDIDYIADLWEVDRRWVNDPFNRKNVPAAMRCYSQKFLKVSRFTLEEWLGWEFKGTPKPKKKQAAHLQSIADMKRGKYLNIVMQSVKENPQAKKIDIERDTGLNRRTVSKYYEAAKAMVKV